MFKRLFKITLITLLLLITLGTALPAAVLASEPPDERNPVQEPDAAYLTAIQNTTAMVTDAQACCQ